MTTTLKRWSKDGGPAVRALPPFDRDAQGNVWTSLETSAEGRAACGWEELPSVPAVVTMPQARVALHAAGLLDDVDAWVAELTDVEAKIYWSSSAELRRTSARLTSMAAAFGLTEAQLDDLFRAAGAVP